MVQGVHGPSVGRWSHTSIALPITLEAAQVRGSRRSQGWGRWIKAHTQLTQMTSTKMITYSLFITYSNWWPLD